MKFLPFALVGFMAVTALAAEPESLEAEADVSSLQAEVDRRLDGDDYSAYDYYWLQNDWDEGTDWCIGSKGYYLELQKCNFGYDKDYAYKYGYYYSDYEGQLWYQDDYGLIHSKKDYYKCWERTQGNKIKLAYCDYKNYDQIFKFYEVKVKVKTGYYDYDYAYDYRYLIKHGYKKCITHQGNSPDQGDAMKNQGCKNTRRFRYTKHYYYDKEPVYDYED